MKTLSSKAHNLAGFTLPFFVLAYSETKHEQIAEEIAQYIDSLQECGCPVCRFALILGPHWRN